MIPNQPRSPYYTDQHEAWRDAVRRFVEKEPSLYDWDRMNKSG